MFRIFSKNGNYQRTISQLTVTGTALDIMHYGTRFDGTFWRWFGFGSLQNSDFCVTRLPKYWKIFIMVWFLCQSESEFVHVVCSQTIFERKYWSQWLLMTFHSPWINFWCLSNMFLIVSFEIRRFLIPNDSLLDIWCSWLLRSVGF
jgi:hypothetical protein